MAKRKANILEMSASDFLADLSNGVLRENFEIVVEGDVDLRASAVGRSITKLPDMRIKGNLYADQTCSLKETRCRVTKTIMLDNSLVEQIHLGETRFNSTTELFARNCENLERVTGAKVQTVDLENSGISVVTRQLDCKGTVNLQGCRSLKRVGCRAGVLKVSASGIEEIGEESQIGWLYAEGCRNLRRVPPIKVDRAVFDRSGVREVDPNFFCSGTGSFKGCAEMTNLSGEFAILEVGGAPLKMVTDLKCNRAVFDSCPSFPESVSRVSSNNVIFHSCRIKTVPQGFAAATDLELDDCRELECLPEKWGGGLVLKDLPGVTETPEDFACAGFVVIAGCKNLRTLRGKFGKTVRIDKGCSALRDLRGDLRVTGGLLAFYACLRSVACEVGGDVSIIGGTIEETFPSFSVGGAVALKHCSRLKSLRGHFANTVTLENCHMPKLGADFECLRDLKVEDCPRLETMNCVVHGNVEIEEAPLKTFGPAFFCGGILRISGCEGSPQIKGEVKGDMFVDGKISKQADPGNPAPLRPLLKPSVSTNPARSRGRHPVAKAREARTAGGMR